MRQDQWAPSARLPYSNVLSLLVHANSKVGKTTLAGTSPKPLLLLDAEGGSKFLPYPKTYWDPMTGPPPACDGTWEVCVVVVRSWETLSMTLQYLVMGAHCFASLCIDSITEVQRRLKNNLVGTDAMKQQDWGVLLTRMETLVRDYRDLTLHPTNPISVATFIAETRETNGRYKPYMQGAMGVSLPYLMDVIGYLYVADAVNPHDPTGMPVRQRQLLVSPHPQYEAGERVQGRLGDVVYEPNVEMMLYTVYAS